MLKRQPLTEKEIKFIKTNYDHMTYEEIREELNLKSVYRITMFIKENGLKKSPPGLNEEQKKFVRENIDRVTLQEMKRRFKLKSVHTIQKFKSEEGLMKVAKSKAKVIDGEFFNVAEKWSWIV